MKNNVNEIGVMKYGNLRFRFFATRGVLDFFENKEVYSDSLLVMSQAFYNVVCNRLEIDNDDNKDVEIVFDGVNLDSDGVNEKVSGYMDFDSFPLDIDGNTYFLNFGAMVK